MPGHCNRESAIPELLGEAALYIRPRQPSSLAAALHRVLDSPDLRKQMSEDGMVAASRLSWEAAARRGARDRGGCQRVTRPISFLHLTTFYPPRNFGGDGIYLHRLAQALASAGHEVDIVPLRRLVSPVSSR